MARQAREPAIPSRQLFEKNPLPMWVYDLKTLAFLAVNDAAVRHYGYSRREFLAMTITQIRPPGDPPAPLEEIPGTIRGSDAAGTWRHRKKDGTIITVEITTHTIRFAGRKTILVHAYDITERKRLEQSFNKAAREWRKTFDAMADAVAWIDPDGRIVRCNKALTIVTKKDYPDIIGHYCEDVVYGTSMPTEACPIKKVMATHKRAIATLPSGSLVYKVTADPLFDESGEFIGAIHIMSEITHQVHTDTFLKQLILQQKAILDNIPDIAWLKDDQCRFLAVNEPFGKACGCAPDDVIGKTDFDIWPRELAQRYRTDDLEVMKSGKRKIVEEPLADKTQEAAWIETIKTPVVDDQGRVVGTTGIARNITARKSAAADLLFSEKKFRALFEAANDAIFIVDMNGRYIDVNTVAHERLGYTKEEMLSKSVSEIDTPEFAARVPERIEQIRRCGKAIFESAHRRKDGTVMPVEINASVVDQEGRKVFYSIVRDITDRKKLQEELYRISRDWEETFDTITDMVTVHDKDYNIIRSNAAAEKILGLPLLQEQPAKCFEYYHGTGCPPAGCPSCLSLVSGKPSVNEMFEPHLQRYIEIRAIPRLSPDGQIAGLIHVVRDITERQRADAARREQLLLSEFGMHIGSALNKEGSPQEILTACTDHIVADLHAAFARIWTLTPDGKTLVLQASSGIYTHRDGPHGVVPIDADLKIPTIARTRKPHLTNAVIGDPLVNQEWAVREGMVAFAGYPLQSGARLVGVMGLFSKTPLDDLTLNALETVANNIALGIERSTGEEALKRYSAELSALSTASSNLLALSELSEIHDGICRFAQKIFGVELVWLGLIDADGVTVTIAGSAGTRKEYLRTLKVTLDDSPAGRGPTGLAILSRQPHLARRDSPEYAPWRAAAEKHGLAASLAVPLISSIHAGTCIGALNLYSSLPDHFDSGRVRLCQIFASLAAVAIDNARLVEGLEEKVAERTQELVYTNAELLDVNQELELRRLEAESASRAKSDFLANMSHELRTPLNAIIGFSDMMIRGMSGPLTERQREYLGDILSSGRHLLSLINDILDLSKVEAGKMLVESSEFDLEELIGRSLTLFREKALKHRLDLRSQIGGTIEPMLGDERKIRQVLYNLVSNAVKFTPDGGTIIVGARSVSDDGRDWAEISVSDTGIGISPEDQKRLFHPFSQISHHMTKEQEGTGLGLALCKSFLQMHGGSIRLQSAPGQGSTFTFRVPLRFDKDAP